MTTVAERAMRAIARYPLTLLGVMAGLLLAFPLWTSPPGGAASEAADSRLAAVPLAGVMEAGKRPEGSLRRPVRLTATVAFDGTPTFRGLALMLGDARRHGWRGVLTSSDRRRGVAERFGRQSQYRLWRGFVRGLPGYLPANPPGRSTHELRSDGVAYPGPVGRRLKWWQLGMDTSDAPRLRRVLRRLGYAAWRPYPVRAEVHHSNLKRSPYRTLKKRRLA